MPTCREFGGGCHAKEKGRDPQDPPFRCEMPYPYSASAGILGSLVSVGGEGGYSKVSLLSATLTRTVPPLASLPNRQFVGERFF